MALNQSNNNNNNGVPETIKTESLGNGKASEQPTIVEPIGSSMQEESKWLGTGVASSSGIHSFFLIYVTRESVVPFEKF